MKIIKSKDKNFQDIADEYYEYQRNQTEKHIEYREGLADQYCKKIYDALFLELDKNNKDLFKFTEILNITKMTRPTLSLHLKHLEEKRFITKKTETKYKTIYRVNLIKVIKICRYRKTITGKEKMELTDISKLKRGERFIPMQPVKKTPIKDQPPSSSNKKSKVHYKSHKNKP